jgi:phosphinothricin acetyltransferase
MENISITPFNIENFDAIIRLWDQCEGVGLSSADSGEKIEGFLIQNPGMSFIASRDGRIVGTILAGHDGRRGYIYHLAVLPELRRQGIGRSLVDRSLQALQGAGIQKCHLFVFQNNKTGIAFWRSIDWAERTDLKVMSRVIEAVDKGPSPERETTRETPSIRKMTEEDWPAVKTIYEEGMATGNATFEREAPSWEEWDAGHLKDCRLVAAVGGKVAGWAALSRVSGRCVYSGVAEVSIYVAAGERGRGIGKKLLQVLIPESEQNGIWTLQAGIFHENLSSINLHRNCGFRLIGRRERLGQMLGRWRDVLMFERRSPTIGIRESLPKGIY